MMGYLECGAGRGFERLEEKRTSREHVVMDALMGEGRRVETTIVVWWDRRSGSRKFRVQ